MHTIAHGIDLTDIPRISQMLQKHGQHFLDRCFTPTEQELASKGMTARRDEFLAGRFAAKEAVLKALGTGISEGINWTDVEVLRIGNGKPKVILHNMAADLAAEQGIQDVLISISHIKSHAMASAIAIGSSAPN
ncbi:Holo-[acyl-carrier-protein] synthase [Poriferisphaera corsica]|uniref:Holo-[acyl-carrier-protein] synthase n=1 Tax=Poriferisphaera corsica TaxID=2528020 RepID=A0A517YV01_9BACT|nr:holo-ACP synthase [Poriferisphaera corsica]QDU34078.1 Holo-[acyl-carrier-protein] synthase [Poriferisphaera corsica]